MSPEIDVMRSWSRPTGRTPWATRRSFVGFSHAWERSPEAVQGSDREAMRLRFTRRMAQIEEQLDMFASDLAALKASPLGALKAMVDDAAAKGKDLVRETVARLKRDIMVATNRLDAIRPPR